MDRHYCALSSTVATRHLHSCVLCTSDILLIAAVSVKLGDMSAQASDGIFLMTAGRHVASGMSASLLQKNRRYASALPSCGEF